jgi:hypothetical protein
VQERQTVAGGDGVAWEGETHRIHDADGSASLAAISWAPLRKRVAARANERIEFKYEIAIPKTREPSASDLNPAVTGRAARLARPEPVLRNILRSTHTRHDAAAQKSHCSSYFQPRINPILDEGRIGVGEKGQWLFFEF